MADLPLGVLGRSAIAWVSDRGQISFADGSPDLAWHVAADDRWHDPSREAAVRRTDRGGLPVVSTRMRIPGGDVVHTAWCVVGPRGPVVVVEIENDSPMAIAVAFTRTDLSLSRAGTSGVTDGRWPAPGLRLDAPPTVVPIGHRSIVRLAVARDVDVSGLPSTDAVAAGWSKVLEASSRLVLPDRVGGEPIEDRVARAKVAIALGGPFEPSRDADELAHWLLDRFHAARLGAWATDDHEVAAAVERIVRASRRSGLDPLRATAVRAAATWLSASEPRVLDDVAAAVSRVAGSAAGIDGVRLVDDGSLRRGALVSAVEESLVCWLGDDRVALCPDAPTPDRLGSSFEGHGIALPRGARASLAVRWHGANAAVLWELSLPTVRLSSAFDREWSSNEPSGESLWRVGRVDSGPAPVGDSVSFG